MICIHTSVADIKSSLHCAFVNGRLSPACVKATRQAELNRACAPRSAVLSMLATYERKLRNQRTGK